MSKIYNPKTEIEYNTVNFDFFTFRTITLYRCLKCGRIIGKIPARVCERCNK